MWHLRSLDNEASDVWSPSLLVGRCRDCFQCYYGFFATFMDAELVDVEEAVFGHADDGHDTYHLCELLGPVDIAPSNWLLREHRTLEGVLHEHTFGLFALTRASVMARGAGTPWQHAALVIASLCDDMGAHSRQRRAGADAAAKTD